MGCDLTVDVKTRVGEGEYLAQRTKGSRVPSTEIWQGFISLKGRWALTCSVTNPISAGFVSHLTVDGALTCSVTNPTCRFVSHLTADGL